MHFVIKPMRDNAGDEYVYSYLRGVLDCINRLDTEFGITEKGFSLIYQYNKNNDMPVFHITSGRRIARQNKEQA